MRFVKNCRSKRPNLNALTSDELREAETLWVRDMQSRISKEKLKDLEKHIGNLKDKKGILRCQGRLANSSLTYDTQFPILLPKEHYVSHLIIWNCHKRVLHNGTKETLQELRSRFWIVRGRQLVKRILRSCILCQKLRGLSYSTPPYSQLPAFRVQEDYAFASVGIDFAGPLYVKSSSSHTEKAYIALFTCATSRAVHVEMVPDLKTETFLLCFKRFVSRRGLPQLVVTDNAKTFKAFSNLYKQP